MVEKLPSSSPKPEDPADLKSVESSSTLTHLKEVQAKKPIVSLRGAKAVVLEGTQLPKSLEVENNALLSLFIEEIWKKINEYRLEHQAEMEGEISSKIGSAQDYVSVVRVFDKVVWSTVFLSVINRWYDERIKRLDTLPEAERNALDKAFERLLKVQDIVHGKTPVDTKDELVLQVPPETKKFIQKTWIIQELANGFGTAAEIILGLLAVIPKVYKSQFGKPIDASDMEELANNLKPLILRLAVNDLESHIVLSKIITSPSNKDGQLRDIEAGAFYISKVRDKLTLEIEKEVIDAVLSFEQNPMLPRTGCPALESRGVGGKSVVVELYELYMELAKKFYFTQMARLNKRQES